MKNFFKQMLKVSTFYLEKQKVLFINKYLLARSQYQNKKALFTDPIFSEGFGQSDSLVLCMQHPTRCQYPLINYHATD